MYWDNGIKVPFESSLFLSTLDKKKKEIKIPVKLNNYFFFFVCVVK